MKHFRMFSIFALLILSACSAGAAGTPTPDGNAVATSAFATAFAYLTETGEAVTATPTATATSTPEPPTLTPTIMPTIQPIIGVLRGNSNLRDGPGKGGNERVGGVMFNQQVKVIGRNVQANWLWIIYAEAESGTAWVLASAVDLQGDLTHLPIVIPRANGDPVIFPPIIYEITGAPLPLNAPAADAKTANVTQLANVRVGPGAGYSIIGSIEAGAVVTVTGRIHENGWIQIEYPSGLDGRGWVVSDLVKMNTEFASLPFFNLMGTPVSKEEAEAGIEAAYNVEPTQDPNATAGPTSTPEPPPAGPPGEVYQASEINVRSGPASTYDLLGTLKSGEKVTVTGLTLNRLWYQIIYAAGPDGHAWVSSKYIRITGGDMRKLPYFDDQGNQLPDQ